MNTIYESKNDYMIIKPEEYKVCPVTGYQVYYKHDYRSNAGINFLKQCEVKVNKCEE